MEEFSPEWIARIASKIYNEDPLTQGVVQPPRPDAAAVVSNIPVEPAIAGLPIEPSLLRCRLVSDSAHHLLWELL